MTQGFSGRTLLQVIPKLEGGGAEQTTLEVARAFIAAGGRSLVVSSGGSMVEALVADGSDHIAMPVDSKNPWLLAQNARDLAGLIEAESADLVHARSRAPAWSALYAARRTKRPFVTTYHGAYRARTSLKRLYNSVMVRADAVIANSQFTASAIEETYRQKPYFDEGRMTVIPRGADVARLAPEAIAPPDVEKAASLFGDGLKVLLPGRFTPWKGQKILVDAVAALRESHPDLKLSVLMIGRMDEKTDYVEHLRHQIASAGLGDAITLLPATNHLAPLLAAADLVVSASTEPEAFGRVAIEAQAAGTPVIATAHGGALETVIDGDTGLFIEPGNVQALASALLTFHAYPREQREAMGRRGTIHALSRYSTRAMTDATLSVYHRLLERWECRGERQRS